jgi:Ca2+-binding RTX toxin-like protein
MYKTPGVVPVGLTWDQNPDIDGLLYGWKWDTNNITYSFPTSTDEYTYNFNPLYEWTGDMGYEEIDGFQAFNGTQQSAVKAILNKNISSFANLTFTPEDPYVPIPPPSTGLDPTDYAATLRFAEADEINYTGYVTLFGNGTIPGLHLPGDTGKGYGSAESNPPSLPSDNAAAPTAFYARGDSWFNATSFNSPFPGTYAYESIMHEIGHDLGLKHGQPQDPTLETRHGADFGSLPPDHDSFEYSIMTYAPYVGFSGGPDGATDHPTTFMQDDIAALQYLYGAKYDTVPVNTVYSWDWATGQEFINGQGEGLIFGDSYYTNSRGGTSDFVDRHNTVFMTVWDGGGNDTYDFSNYTSKMSIDLRPGAYTVLDTSASHFYRAFLGNDPQFGPQYAHGNIYNALADPNDPTEMYSFIENAVGGTGYDIITGNDADNVLTGGLGNDTITGGQGYDTMYGGEDDDTLVATYKSLRGFDTMDGGAGINTADFSNYHDPLRIDLSADAAWSDGADAASATLQVAKLVSIQNVIGGAGEDELWGDGGDNRIDGGLGNDTIHGGGGKDTLISGLGVDSIYGEGDDDTLVGTYKNNPFAFDYLDGGSGINKVDFSDYQNAVRVDLSVGTAWTSDGADVASGNPLRQVAKLVSIQDVLGGTGNDEITGDSNNNTLDGGAGYGQDTAIFHGARADYTIKLFADGDFQVADSVAGRDGTDLLKNIDNLRFSDGDFTRADIASHTNTAPVAMAADHSVAKNAALAAASLFSVSDADGDAMTSYAFWDSTADATSGHFVVNGVAQASGQLIMVSAAQLAQTTFQTGATADDLWVQAFDGAAWSGWKEFHLTPPVNHAPVITTADENVAKNASLAASSLFQVSDSDGDAMTQYQFWDSTADATSGHFVVNGVAQASGQLIMVSAAQLAQTTFQTGTTADDLWVRAFDGTAWSDWKEFHLTPPVNHVPVVAAADENVAKNASLAASSLFQVSDSDGDAMAQYQFWDSTADGTSGHFAINGAAQGSNQLITVSAAQLAQTTFQTGTTADDLWVRAFDGTAWSDWKEFHLTPPVNHVPVVAAADENVAKNASLAASSLFQVSDSDGDAMTQYQFWDSTADATSGHFAINGVAQGSNQLINVSAAQLAQTTFQTGTTADDLWVRAFDGTAWSDWKEFHLTPPVNHVPVVAAADENVAKNASLAASSLFQVSDSDGDAMTQYQFWDSTADGTSGHFAINGVTQGTGQSINVSAAQLAQTTFQTGTTADDLWVRAYDGTAWSDWKEFHLTATGQTLVGTEGADTLRGTGDADYIEGLGGNDQLFANGGSDTLLGGDGDDMIWCNDSVAHVDGGAGYDILLADESTDGGFHFTVLGSNIEAVEGRYGNDVIDARGLDQLITVATFDGDDRVLGGNGGVDYYAGSGNDTFIGGAGSDMVLGGDGNDVIDGGGPTSSPYPYGDRLWGEAGDDVITGSGNGWVFGGDGNDRIFGGDGDLLEGEAGNDTIAGGAGLQQIIGGVGDDILSGGAGGDRFDYEAGWGHDVILDFNVLEDVLGLHTVAGLTSFSQLAITDTAQGAQIAFGADTITLTGVGAAQLTAKNLLLPANVTPPAVGAGETITLGSAYAGEVSFLSDTGTLTLEDSSSFTGTVAGLHGRDAIDLADIGFGASSTLGYSANADNSGGTLSVGDGTHMANIALLGSYMASSFVAASDGHGGTLISETAQSATQMPVVTQPHA